MITLTEDIYKKKYEKAYRLNAESEKSHKL